MTYDDREKLMGITRDAIMKLREQGVSSKQ
jgi:hypothetical protein